MVLYFATNAAGSGDCGVGGAEAAFKRWAVFTSLLVPWGRGWERKARLFLYNEPKYRR